MGCAASSKNCAPQDCPAGAYARRSAVVVIAAQPEPSCQEAWLDEIYQDVQPRKRPAKAQVRDAPLSCPYPWGLALCVPEADHSSSSTELLGAPTDQGWLDRSRSEVEGFGQLEVQSWVAAVLCSAQLHGDLLDVTRGPGRVLDIFRKNEVTGCSLLQLDLEKLLQDGVARGPAEVLARRLDQLRAPEPADAPEPAVPSSGEHRPSKRSRHLPAAALARRELLRAACAGEAGEAEGATCQEEAESVPLGAAHEPDCCPALCGWTQAGEPLEAQCCPSLIVPADCECTLLVPRLWPCQRPALLGHKWARATVDDAEGVPVFRASFVLPPPAKEDGQGPSVESSRCLVLASLPEGAALAFCCRELGLPGLGLAVRTANSLPFGSLRPCGVETGVFAIETGGGVCIDAEGEDGVLKAVNRQGDFLAVGWELPERPDVWKVRIGPRVDAGLVSLAILGCDLLRAAQALQSEKA